MILESKWTVKPRKKAIRKMYVTYRDEYSHDQWKKLWYKPNRINLN